MVLRERRFVWFFPAGIPVPSVRVIDKKVNVYEGYNFRVLEVPGFEKITFGCPPGIVKDFARREEELPPHYILPTRTLVKGKNNFDFEFIVYSFLFIRKQKEKISIYCTQDQRRRLEAIMGETLFGPTFHQMLCAQFRSLLLNGGYSPAEQTRFEKFLKTLAQDKKLSGKLKSMMQSQVKDDDLLKELTAWFKKIVQSKPWIQKKRVSPAGQFARNYLQCFQLQQEMDLFSLTRDCSRKEFLDRLMDFHIFGKDKSVIVESRSNPKKQLKVVQVQPSCFEIFENDKLKAELDFHRLDTPPVPDKINLLKKPRMGATFLGVGSGFCPYRRNSCVIIWVEGRGVMVDAFSDNNEVLLAHGITENDIGAMFLSHVHSDHDAGFIEKVLSGQRLQVMTSRIIFESFLRKIEAITLFPCDVIESFIDFVELEPGKKVKVPGYENTWIEFDYSLHSIPSGRLRLTYVNPRGKEQVISHSGDTKYDRNLIHRWYDQGVFSMDRYQRIMGFIWDADLIIHEVGGGQLHTEFSALTELNPEIAKKMILTHQHKNSINHPYFHFAEEGETRALLAPLKKKTVTPLAFLKGISLFQEVSQANLKNLLKKSRVVEFSAGSIIFTKNDIGESFYVILDGFAEIILGGKMNAVYERGMFFGELAITTENPLRRGTVKALSNLTLLEIPKKLYLESKLPTILDDFYRLDNHFSEVVRPSLVASLGFGSLAHWKRGETIFSKQDNHSVYLLLSGKVKISTSQGKKIAFLSSGDIMGEVSDWRTIVRKAEVKADSEEVFAVQLEPDQITQLFKLYPSFYGTVYQKIKKLEARLAKT